jgi:hypothetical protein
MPHPNTRISRAILWGFALIAATPAGAEVDFRRDEFARVDVEVMVACLDTAGDADAAKECAFLTFDLCVARLDPGQVSHAAEGGCASRELDLWTHLYQLEFAELEAWAILKDASMRAAGDNRISARTTLERSEQAWRDYKDAACAFIETRRGGGTIGMTADPYCQMRHILERLFWLKNARDLHLPEAP